MAEVQTKIIKCPACNQYYDAAKTPGCPYCGGQAAVGSFGPTIDPGIQGNFSPTIDPDMMQPGGMGSFTPTVDPYANQMTPTVAPGANESSKFSETIYVDTSVPKGMPAPVVGWLVAVSGSCMGLDFRIHTGYNSIGRESGDIVLKGDTAVSGHDDSTLVFEPKSKKFYIAHKSGKNVLSVNGVPVIGSDVELNAFDRVVIGNSELVFVPLCGDKFSWKEGIVDA